MDAHHVLDLFDQVEHRHTRPDPGCDRRHRRVGDSARTFHHRKLFRRLRPSQLVHERRPGHDTLRRQGGSEVDHRLGPAPVADRERACLAEAARRRLEQRRSVVAFADDDQLARQLAGHVEQRHHPRQDEDRLAARAEERARDPAVGVLRLAERRDHALDPGEVLQIGGGGEEEEVDAGLVHPVAELPPPLGVVEHDGRV